MDSLLWITVPMNSLLWTIHYLITGVESFGISLSNPNNDGILPMQDLLNKDPYCKLYTF